MTCNKLTLIIYQKSYYTPSLGIKYQNKYLDFSKLLHISISPLVIVFLSNEFLRTKRLSLVVKVKIMSSKNFRFESHSI